MQHVIVSYMYKDLHFIAVLLLNNHVIFVDILMIVLFYVFVDSNTVLWSFVCKLIKYKPYW